MRIKALKKHFSPYTSIMLVDSSHRRVIESEKRLVDLPYFYDIEKISHISIYCINDKPLLEVGLKGGSR